MTIAAAIFRCGSTLALILTLGCGTIPEPMASPHSRFQTIKMVFKGIAHPVRSGGASGETQNDILALARARMVVDASDPIVAAALTNPTACDPTDADGNPNDDDCPSSPAPPAKP